MEYTTSVDYDEGSFTFYPLDRKLISKEKPPAYTDNEYYKGNNTTLYSDRLLQWDYDKFNACCQQVWGNTRQNFYNRTPEEIERFLSIYLAKSVKLTRITQETNASTGCPYWRFDIKKRREIICMEN